MNYGLTLENKLSRSPHSVVINYLTAETVESRIFEMLEAKRGHEIHMTILKNKTMPLIEPFFRNRLDEVF